MKNEEDNFEYEDYLIDDETEDILDDLGSGIDALDMTYLYDKRVEKLVEPFKKAIYFMKTHTTLTEEEIIARVNQNIKRIELKDGYEGNLGGIGYVSGMLNILSINASFLEREPKKIYEFIRHEMTHMLGNLLKREFLRKDPVLISGYSRESIFSQKVDKYKNESFNEAAVEMFVYQDEKYEQYKICDEISINTNQDFNEGYYCTNSNLIHQMILARGIEKQEFFEGLYDYKKAQKNIRKFPKRIFRKISENMDRIGDDITDYLDADDRINDMKQKGEKGPFDQYEKEKHSSRENCKKRISESERMIIDKLLVPRLRKIPVDEKHELLDTYFQFIICEKEYFKQKTGYQAIKTTQTTDNPWFKHVDVEPLALQEPKERKEKRSKDFRE